MPIAPSRTRIRSRRMPGSAARREVAVERRRRARPGRRRGDGRALTACPSGRPGRRAVRDRLHRVARPDPPDELRALLVPAEARHDVRPGNLALHRGQEVVGHLDPDLRAALAGGSHRRPRLVGDRDPGHLVVEELGVPGRDERQHPEEDRHRACHAGRTAGGPPRASPRPARRSTAAGSSPGAPRPRACARAGPIRSPTSAAVESRAQAIVNPARWPIDEPDGSSAGLSRRQDLDQPDRIDVPDARPGRVVADPRRVAGQGDDVPDAEGVGARAAPIRGP